MRLFAILFIIKTSFSFSQNDSLKLELSKPHHDTVKALLYIDLGYSYILSNPDSLYYYADIGYKLSKQLGYKRGEAFGLMRIGQSYKKINANYYKALINFDKALAMAFEINDDNIKARCYSNISTLYLEQNDFQNSLEYAYKQLEMFKKIKDDEWITASMLNLSEIYFDMDSIEKANIYIEECYKRGEIKDFFKIDMYLKFALIRERQNNYLACDSILKYIKLKLENINGLEYYKGKFEYLLAKRNLQMKNIKVSIQNAENALSFFQISGDQNWIINCYELIALAKEQNDDIIGAYSALKLAKLNKDKTFNNNIKSLTEFWSYNQKRKETDVLVAAKDLLIAKENSEKKLVIAFVIFLIISTIGLGFTILMRNKYNKSLEVEKAKVILKNELLQQQQDELATINEELHSQQEELQVQRDVVKSQYDSLEKAQKIIESRNEEISNKNVNLENEVHNRTKEIIEYSQQLEQFAFISAHNLRGPVARILGLGQLLEIHNKTYQDEQMIKDKLILSTKELDRVVKDLNTILEIKKNNTNKIVEVDLFNEILTIKSSLEQEIRISQTKIITDFSEVRSLNSIKPYLDSIFLNLLSNAIKYKHAERPPIIEIKSKLIKDLICVSIKDNGIGINLNLFKEKIFTLYSRFHYHVEGKGLGLYLVKTQMQAMGGSVEVESEVGMGTTFNLYFKVS